MLLELIRTQSFWALIGVLFGFLLGEGTRYIRYRLRRYRLERIIEEELKSILVQIPQKKDITVQMIDRLNNRRILSGLSVGIINTGYKQHISELYEHLTLLQRNCLHVIHEYLNIAEKILFSFEKNFMDALLKEKNIHDPFETYKGRLQDVLESYDKVESLIKGYLNGKPTDVFYIEDNENNKQ